VQAEDCIVVTHEVGGAPEVSITVTHKRSGLAVWDCGVDPVALRAALFAELAGRVAREHASQHAVLLRKSADGLEVL
jgi:hypothetical protein